MSVTTTENRLYYNTVDILRDYDVHHTNAEEREPLDSTLNEHPIPEPASNPEGWPTDHRRVPPYRPVNRELNQEERAPFGRNVVEGTFIFLMLNGVRINSNISKAWRATGGQINSRLFRYRIGGEW